MKTTDIDYSVGGTKYIGYLAVDEARGDAEAQTAGLERRLAKREISAS